MTVNQQVHPCPVAVDRYGTATWPCTTSVNFIRWLSYRQLFAGVWLLLLLGSIALAFFSPWGHLLAVGLVLFAAYSWYRVWKHFWYGNLTPAILLDKQNSLIAAYSNLSQTNDFFPHIKVAKVLLSSNTLSNLSVGARIVTVPRYEIPIHGTRWVDFHPIPLEQAIASKQAYADCEKRIPQSQWELLQQGLNHLPTPVTTGLFEVPLSPPSGAVSASQSEHRALARPVDLRKHYLIAGALLIGLVSLLIFMRMDPYGGKVRAGDAYAKNGKYKEAISEYDSAIQLSPDAPLAYFHRAIAHQRSGAPLKAQMDFDEVIRLRPNFGPAFRLRALSCQDMQLAEKAASDTAQADKLGTPKAIPDPFSLEL